MTRPPDPNAVAVTVRLSRVEYEALARIGRDGGWPVHEVIVRLMRLGFQGMAEQIGFGPEELARRARR